MRNVKVVSFNSSTVDAGTVRLYHGRQQVIQFDQLDCRFMAGPGKLIAVANLDGIMEYAGSKLTELNFKRLNDLGWKTGKDSVSIGKVEPQDRILKSESGDVAGIVSPLTKVIPENIVDGDKLEESITSPDSSSNSGSPVMTEPITEEMGKKKKKGKGKDGQ